MITKLRKILLTEYIGSILIALLVWQAAVQFITVTVQSGFWLYHERDSQSVLVPSSAKFPWDNIVLSWVSIALYCLAASGLARWLFPDAFTSIAAPSKNEPDRNESEPR